MKRILTILFSLSICVLITFALISCDSSNYLDAFLSNNLDTPQYEVETSTNTINSDLDNNNVTESTDNKTNTTTDTITLELSKETKTYIVTYSATKIQSGHVGDSWSYGVTFNSQDIESNDIIVAELSDGPTFVLYAIEYDSSSNDYENLSVNFPDLAINETETQTHIIEVHEDDGRYSGSIAKWEFTITCERISNNSTIISNPPSLSVDNYFLYTTAPLPIIISTSSGNITIQDMEYMYDPSGNNELHIRLGLALLCEHSISDVIIYFTLFSENDLIPAFEYSLEIDKLESGKINYITFSSLDYNSNPMPIDNYIIDFSNSID